MKPGDIVEFRCPQSGCMIEDGVKYVYRDRSFVTLSNAKYNPCGLGYILIGSPDPRK